MEVGSPEVSFYRMQVAEKAGEESEEWFLLESFTLFFVHIGYDKNNNGQDLGKIMNLRVKIISTTSIAMILDNVDDEARNSI